MKVDHGGPSPGLRVTGSDARGRQPDTVVMGTLKSAMRTEHQQRK